jgi:integrase
MFSLQIPATFENLAYGNRIATQINNDYRAGHLDRTFAKYRPQTPNEWDYYDISQLWTKYCAYKANRWKAKTADYNHRVIGHWINQIPPDWRDSLAVRSYLLRSTTPGMSARVLQSIETCIEWAIRVGLVESQRNPYRKMGSELKRKGGAVAKANALTAQEQEQLIQAFYDSPTWHYYGQFVEFLFLTGCRPSEAVGLHWEQINADCSEIRFDRSVVKIGTEYQVNHLSKTNRSRKFPCNDRLTALLTDIKAASISKMAIFQVNGQYLNYAVFYNRAWKTLAAKVLGRKSTPYSARDTFITRQVEKGKPIALIAKWVDNSIAMIEKNYLDTAAILSIRPD